MKISFIVPAYNGDKYIVQCLDSIIYQGLDNYEIIVVNDGSEDNTKSILNKYKDVDNLYIYELNNTSDGPSEARNFGVEKATGDYLMFVDVDDYLEEKFVKGLLPFLDKSVDMLKFEYSILENKEKTTNSNVEIPLTSGSNAFVQLVKRKASFDATCMYLIKRDFMVKNKFKFAEGRYYEDFGLIPLMIVSCKRFISVDAAGYVYRMTENSIMRDNNYKSIVKKAYDVIYHYDYLIGQIDDLKIKAEVKKIFKSYIANAVLLKEKSLKDKEKKEYQREIKFRKVYNNLLDDTFKRRRKKSFIKFKYKFIKE